MFNSILIKSKKNKYSWMKLFRQSMSNFQKVEKKVSKELPVLKAPKPIVDIGINLTHKNFRDDIDEVLKRAKDSNVTRLILTGTSEKHSKWARDFIEDMKNSPVDLYFTAGVHPHDAKECDDKTIKFLTELSKDKRCVAIGECGLDFDRNFSEPKDQELWFENQVKLAEELKLPLFLHERSAHKKFVEILSKYKVKACVHCFTGTKEELEVYLKLGYYIGITGWICDERRGTDLASIVSKIPLNRLMIET